MQSLRPRPALLRAIADRDAQIDHIAADRPLAAVKQCDELERQVAQLEQQPRPGRPGRVKGTHALAMAGTRRVVVYQVRPPLKRVELLRVLHAAEQWLPG